MKRCWFLLLTALLVLVTAVPVQAHEKWFVDSSQFPTDWSFAANPISLVLIVAALLAAIVWRLFFSKFPSPEIKPLAYLGRLAPWVPRLLGVHLGVSLLALAARGAFLAPSLSVHAMPGGDALALAEGALGAWFLSGFKLRQASVVFILLGPLSLLISGPVSLLEALPLLGIAGFLIVLPPTADRWGATEVNAERVRIAVQMLRLGVGLGLIVIAFSEKWANPALAQAILDETPQLNVFGLLGLQVDTQTFIRIAATTELLFGLLILSGAGPQLVVLVAGVPFNATLLLFGGTELIGHLPAYGAFLALIAYGSLPATSRQLSSLRPTPYRRLKQVAGI